MNSDYYISKLECSHSMRVAQGWSAEKIELIVRWTLPLHLPCLCKNVYLSKGQSFLKATSLLSYPRLWLAWIHISVCQCGPRYLIQRAPGAYWTQLMLILERYQDVWMCSFASAHIECLAIPMNLMQFKMKLNLVHFFHLFQRIAYFIIFFL